MVGGRSNSRQSSGIINSFPISQGFKGNQSLVVVHGQYSIKFLLLISGKKSIGTIGTVNQHIMFRIFNCRFDDVFFFPADQSLVASMWIKPEYRNTRFI